MANSILRCPKCHAGMTSSWRDGVAVDQCADCRGVFLGELEFARLVESVGATPHGTQAVNGYQKQAYEGRHRRA